MDPTGQGKRPKGSNFGQTPVTSDKHSAAKMENQKTTDKKIDKTGKQKTPEASEEAKFELLENAEKRYNDFLCLEMHFNSTFTNLMMQKRDEKSIVLALGYMKDVLDIMQHTIDALEQDEFKDELIEQLNRHFLRLNVNIQMEEETAAGRAATQAYE